MGVDVPGAEGRLGTRTRSTLHFNATRILPHELHPSRLRYHVPPQIDPISHALEAIVPPQFKYNYCSQNDDCPKIEVFTPPSSLKMVDKLTYIEEGEEQEGQLYGRRAPARGTLG